MSVVRLPKAPVQGIKILYLMCHASARPRFARCSFGLTGQPLSLLGLIRTGFAVFYIFMGSL